MGKSSAARSLLISLGDIFLPRTCLVCGRRLLRHERHLCLCCAEDLPRTYFFARERHPMADRFNGMLERYLSAYEPYVRATALFFYDGHSGYRRIPQSLKYQGNLAAGRDFGRLLADDLARGAAFADIDCVMPVPLHPLRRWRRGYNQAEILARAVAESLGVPCLDGVLRRTRHTRTQTRLGVAEKAANVQGAFTARPGKIPLGMRHILLIDDVFTTGATLCACFLALRRVTDARISIATLAFVGSA